MLLLFKWTCRLRCNEEMHVLPNSYQPAFQQNENFSLHSFWGEAGGHCFQCGPFKSLSAVNNYKLQLLKLPVFTVGKKKLLSFVMKYTVSFKLCKTSWKWQLHCADLVLGGIIKKKLIFKYTDTLVYSILLFMEFGSILEIIQMGKKNVLSSCVNNLICTNCCLLKQVLLHFQFQIHFALSFEDQVLKLFWSCQIFYIKF